MTSTFRDLHTTGDVLVLANAWDAASARIVEDLGARALATSSAAVAWACGYPDGGQLPPSELIRAVERIRRATTIPLSVDLENGYSDDPETVAILVGQLAGIGASGINIEDGEGSPAILEAKISAIKRAVAAESVDMFVNARCDVYLRKLVPPDRLLGETISRAKRYAAAGADGFFPPFIEVSDIPAVVAATELPVNVLASSTLPNIAKLRSMGVRRLSAGGTIGRVAYLSARAAAREFLKTGAFPTVPDSESTAININALLAR
jgi:2-methylisocitrate lyase-like PEP mutase family enzyme